LTGPGFPWEDKGALRITFLIYARVTNSAPMKASKREQVVQAVLAGFFSSVE